MSLKEGEDDVGIKLVTLNTSILDSEVTTTPVGINRSGSRKKTSANKRRDSEAISVSEKSTMSKRAISPKKPKDGKLAVKPGRRMTKRESKNTFARTLGTRRASNAGQ